MPDTRFNWPNLKEHLRKFAVVYVVTVTLCALLTNLLWTTTRPRIPTAQAVLVYLVDSYSFPDPLNDIAEGVVEQMQEEGGDIRAMQFESLLFADADRDYTGSILLMTRLAVAEGDAFFASAEAMEALVRSEALLPLDNIVADGWLSEYGLEPYYAGTTDEATGETTAQFVGLRLDNMKELYELQAFVNEGAFLALPVNGEDTEQTLRALELFFGRLKEAGHAEPDRAE